MATITTPGIDELTLPNHPETKVWLKQRPTWGDRNRVQAAALTSRKQVGPDRFETDPLGFARFIAERTLVMVHDWNATDDSGKKVPLVVEALESLDPEDGDFLEAEARRRYEGESRPLVATSGPSLVTESPSPTPEPSESPA